MYLLKSLKSGLQYPYTKLIHKTFFSLFSESSSMVSNHDIGQTPALDEVRVHRLRSQFRQISGKSLVVATHIAVASNFFTEAKVMMLEATPSGTQNSPHTNSDMLPLPKKSISKFDIAKHIGTTPRILSQLIARQDWLNEEERKVLNMLFAILRPRVVMKESNQAQDHKLRRRQNNSARLPGQDIVVSNQGGMVLDASASDAVHRNTSTGNRNVSGDGTLKNLDEKNHSSPVYVQVSELVATMGQLAQALQRILLYCSHEPHDNELFVTHQKVSIIIQRWIKDYTIGKENELYTESVALSTFKEEERDFKSHMSRLKQRWRTQQQRLLLACFEADHLFCLLVTLDRRFLMQHAVSDEERRMFVTATTKLSKLQQHHNEHVAVELPRWRTIVKEGVVFKEGSLLHSSSINMERALQRRVAAEICNMSFIVLSATYAVVMGGHLNKSVEDFGPAYIPSWWPSVWFGHSIMALLAFAIMVWNWFSLDTIVGGSRYTEGGTIAMSRENMEEKNQPLALYYYYLCFEMIGTSRGTALLLLIVGLLSLVTTVLTVCVLRAIGIIMALS